MIKDLLGFYGLKFDPFGSDVPVEALHTTPQAESFFWRVEHTHLRRGGFALISGDPGQGKSANMRLLQDQLTRSREITVGELENPRASLSDFYRELCELFGLETSGNNRWAGFRSLRRCWLAHIQSTLMRPVLLVDEAQEVSPSALSELRVLASMNFDSRVILGVVLAGDNRLLDRLRKDELLPLGSRMQTRLPLERATPEELLASMRRRLECAGHSSLMTDGLMHTICEHALGNYRVMTNIATDLLLAGAQREQSQLDEKLYLEVCSPQKSTSGKSTSSRRRRT